MSNIIETREPGKYVITYSLTDKDILNEADKYDKFENEVLEVIKGKRLYSREKLPYSTMLVSSQLFITDIIRNIRTHISEKFKVKRLLVVECEKNSTEQLYY